DFYQPFDTVLILYIEFRGGSAEIFFHEGVGVVGARSVVFAAGAERQFERGDIAGIAPESVDASRLDRISGGLAFVGGESSLSGKRQRVWESGRQEEGQEKQAEHTKTRHEFFLHCVARPKVGIWSAGWQSGNLLC